MRADVAQAFGTTPPPSGVGGPCGRDGYVCKTGLICQLPPPFNGQQSHLGTCVGAGAPLPPAGSPATSRTKPDCPDGMHCEADGPPPTSRDTAARTTARSSDRLTSHLPRVFLGSRVANRAREPVQGGLP